MGEKINIAVTVDESLDADLSVVEEIDVEVDSPRAGTGRQEVQSKSSDQTQLNPRYIFETFVIGASNRFCLLYTSDAADE